MQVVWPRCRVLGRLLPATVRIKNVVMRPLPGLRVVPFLHIAVGSQRHVSASLVDFLAGFFYLVFQLERLKHLGLPFPLQNPAPDFI